MSVEPVPPLLASSTTSPRPPAADRLPDLFVAHRDMRQYYGSFGYMDQSTTADLINCVVIPAIDATTRPERCKRSSRPDSHKEAA